MKHLTTNTRSLRNVSRLFLLVVVVAILAVGSSTSPVEAKVQPARQIPNIHFISDEASPSSPLLAPASRRAKRTVSTSLVKVEFQTEGLYVAAKFTANNLKDETIRMALFLGWKNGEWMEANPNAPAEYRSPGGYLTAQTTGTASYTYSIWEYVEFYIPWEYFPAITQDYDVFLQSFVGLDGQEYVANSWRQYFRLFANTD